MRELNIDKSEANQRLDKFLLKYMNKAPKSFIYKMLRKKNIKLNGKKAEGNETLQSGDILTLFLSDETISSFMEEKKIVAQSMDFIIKYEDNNLLVVVKPAGLSVQPDKDNPDRSLNDSLLYYLYKKGEYDTSADATFKPSICNRLDRNTAGLVTMAKTPEASRALNEIFRERNIDKFYLTAVSGNVSKSGEVSGYHTKNTGNKASITAEKREGGVYVLTKYKPIVSKDNMTLLDIKLETGKSHQIRVCMQHIGHSVAGDRKYGTPQLNKFFKEKFGLENQLLLSCKLIFRPKADSPLKYLDGKEITATTDDLRQFTNFKKQNKAIADSIDYFLRSE